MKINSINPSFTGYKNVLTMQFNDEQLQEIHTAMQLTDDATKDLSEFKSLKDIMPKKIKECLYDDTLAIHYINIKKVKNFTPKLYINDVPLLTGQELLALKNKMTSHNEEIAYKNIENWNLKAYTLLAQLTRRMMNDNSRPIQDNGLERVFHHTTDSMGKITGNISHAFNIAHCMTLSKEPYQNTAGIINKKISNTMKVFFA